MPDRPSPSAGPALLVAALVVLGCGVLFARDLGGGDPQHWDEWFTLDRSRNFARTGDWLTVTSNHAPANQKPPLQYWLTAALLATGADTELALRLPPFLFALGSLALTGLLARLVTPDRPWAVPAAIAWFASSTMLWSLGRQGMLDTGQLFFLLATLCGVLAAGARPGLWVPTGVAAGLGALQKSPVTLVFAGAALLVLARGGSPGPYAWRTLRGERRFRVAVLVAVALALAWPLLQAARHGVRFLGPYFGKQMFSRFKPANPFAEDAVLAPLRWAGWILEDAPVTALLSLLGVALVLAVPALRRSPRLRAVTALALISAVVLTIAGGRIYDRYVLVMLPLLAVAGATALATVLPRSAGAAAVGLLLLAAAAPALARVTDEPYARDHGPQRRVGERFTANLRPGESPLFVVPVGEDDFPPGAFLVFTALDRPVLIVHADAWEHLEPKAREARVRPPYFGVCHRRHLADAEANLGRLERVEEVGDYVLWRQAPARPPDDGGR